MNKRLTTLVPCTSIIALALLGNTAALGENALFQNDPAVDPTVAPTDPTDPGTSPTAAPTVAVPMPTGTPGATNLPPLFDPEFSSDLNGANQVPTPGDTDGAGMVHFDFLPELGQLCYHIEVRDILNPTGAHIHRGAAGQVGPVILPVETPVTGLANGCVPVDAALAAEIQANPGNFYFNVHNADFPDGAVRGQLQAFDGGAGGQPTPGATATPGASPTPAATATPDASPTPAVTATPDASPTPAATATPDASPTPAVTATPDASPTPAVTATPDASPTPAVTATPDVSPSPAVTATPDATPTPAVTAIPDASPTPAATVDAF